MASSLHNDRELVLTAIADRANYPNRIDVPGVFRVGGKVSKVRETIKRIYREYGGSGGVPGVFQVDGTVSWARETINRIS